MVDFSVAERMIQEDVALGMDGFLTATEEGHGFRFLEPFEREAEGGFSSPSGAVAIAWGFRGIHAPPRGPEQDDEADPEGRRRRRAFPPHDKLGFVYTGREVDVHGVTIVHTHDGSEQLSRFVDWVGAMASIGVGLMRRPVLDDPSEAGLER